MRRQGEPIPQQAAALPGQTYPLPVIDFKWRAANW